MDGPLNTTIRPEMQLLFCCARTRLDAACSARIHELLGGPLEWPYLLAAAEEQGVSALLYWQLKSGFADEVPAAWMNQLQETFQQNARRNLCLASELIQILEGFRSEGIVAIPYKGPVLAEQAYGNLALRQFLDLDIVVPHSEIVRVHERMAVQGYRAKFPLPGGAEAMRRAPGQYLFRSADGRVVVEIHTERTLRYFPRPLALDSLGQRLERVSLGGREVRTFAAEDALPLLCVHGSKHFWDQLFWVADIAELAQIPRGLRWDASFEQARQLGAERMLTLGLFLANDLLGAPLPEEVLRRIRSDHIVRALAVESRRQILREGGAWPGVWQRFLYRVRMRGNPLEGVRYFFRLATAPTEEDWSSVQLSKPLSPLYAALRPIRLLRKYGLGRGRATDLGDYVSTPLPIVERMLKLAGVGPADLVYDPGCGDGRIVVMAAKQFGARGIGVDVDSRRIAEARANARGAGVEHLIQFVEQDAKTIDFGPATVVALAMRSIGNAKLAQQLRAQLRPGARIVSRGGGIPGWPADQTEEIQEPTGERTMLYLWRIDESSTGALSEANPASVEAARAGRRAH